MSQKIGNYHFAVYSRLSKRLRPPTAENENKLKNNLERLCDIIRDAPFDWFLVGGVGLDMHIGQMTRFHHDIDIEVPSEQINQMLNHMSDAGYSLFRKVLSANIAGNKRLVIYQKPDASECIPEAQSRFRLVKHADGKIIDGDLYLLSYIDVSFTRQQHQGVEVGYKGRSVVLPVPYTGDQMNVEFMGHRIRLRDPLYHAYLKTGRSPIDTFDIDNLKRSLTQEQLALLP